MRQYISGKWKEYGGGYPNYGGVMCYHYHNLPYNSGLSIIVEDPAQEYWLIGKDVEIDIWVQWVFPDHEPERGRRYLRNGGFMVTVENTETGTTGHIWFKAIDIGLTAREGDGIIPLKFKPEDVGITTPGRYPIKIEIEAFAQYESNAWIRASFWDYYDDYGQPLYPLDIPQAVDSLSIEKDGDIEETFPFHYGYTDNLLVIHVGELPSVTEMIFITIASNLPAADFSVSPVSGPAPLVVAFQNLSQSDPYFPITDTRWYFGDGGTSNDPGFEYYVMHEYKTPGTYTARCIVTNDAGSSEATKTITVAVAAPKPVIDEEGTYLPQAIPSLDKTFGLVFKIKNMGGATKIWLRSICRTTRVLMDNVNLPAYGEVTIVTSPHDISWYCGYVPAVETPINILFEVGPAGGIVSDNLPWETFVTESNEVEFCPYNSHWDEATKSCVPDEAKTSKKAWWVIGAGAVAALFGALAFSGRKKG